MTRLMSNHRLMTASFPMFVLLPSVHAVVDDGSVVIARIAPAPLVGLNAVLTQVVDRHEVEFVDHSFTMSPLQMTVRNSCGSAKYGWS